MRKQWLPFLVGLTVGVLFMLPFAWRPDASRTEVDALRAQLIQAMATAEELRRSCQATGDGQMPGLSRERTDRP